MKAKKTFLSLLLALLACIALLAFVACGEKPENQGDTPPGTQEPGDGDHDGENPNPGGQDQETPAEPEAVSLAFDPSEIVITVGDPIDYSQIEITVSYSDNTTDTVTLTEAMVDAEDLNQISSVGEYDLTINCMGLTGELGVTVNPMVMSGVTVNDASAVYNGSAVLPTVTGTPSGAKVSYAFYTGTEAVEANKVDSAVDAGTYLAVVTVTATNYETYTDTATITIAKAAFDSSAISWEGLEYTYTGEEITLSAVPSGMPEGFTFSEFTATGTQQTAATEPGRYFATANFTGENKNYTLAPFAVEWGINSSYLGDKWYTAADGKLIGAEFVDQDDDGEVDAFSFDGAAPVACTIDQAEGTISVDGFLSVTLANNVLRVEESAGKVYSMIVESTLKRFAGEYSTYAEDFTITIDTEAGTASLLTKVLGQDAITHTLSLEIGESDSAEGARLCVDGSDVAFLYVNAQQRLQIENYANPAAYGQINSYDVLLFTKAEAEELLSDLPAGTFMDVTGSDVLTVSKDGSMEYNGYAVVPYCYYEQWSSFYDPDLIVAFAYDTNHLKVGLGICDGYYEISGSYGEDVFVPEEYVTFAGQYYKKDAEGLHSDDVVQFLYYSSYFRLTYAKTDYNFGAEDKSFTLSVADGKMTAVLKAAGAEDITLVFDGATVAAGSVSYAKVAELIADEYSDGNGVDLAYDGEGTFTYNGEESSSFVYSIENGQHKVVLTLAEKSITITWDDDERFVDVDGVMFVEKDLEDGEDGRTADIEYVYGDTVVSFDGDTYTIGDKKLTDVVYSLVDDGNNVGRFVLQAAGKLDGQDCTIVHYSQAAWIIDGETYIASIFAGLYETEFRPTADSQDTFEFETDGSMLFRGREIFLTSVSTYSHFYATFDGKLYYYSFDVNGLSLTFNDSINYNIAYAPSAYFLYGGAYVSQDKTQAFYFAPELVYYNNTNTSDFAVSVVENGATMRVDDLQAVFSGTGSSAELTLDGVTYDRVPDFNFENMFGTYALYDGPDSDGSSELEFSSVDDVGELVIIGGNIAVYVDGGWSSGSGYLIRNPEGSTQAQAPYLAVDEYYGKMIGYSVPFQGETFTIQLATKQKTGSTDLMADVFATLGNQRIDFTYQYGSYFMELDGVSYDIELNTDETTKDKLPLLVYESWWSDFEDSYTFNGKTTVLSVVAGGTDDAPAAELSVTYDGKPVEATFEAVTAGWLMNFTLDGVKYVGVLNEESSLELTVYTETAYNFFYSSETVTVDGKELILNPTLDYAPGSYSEYVLVIDLNGSSYGEEKLTAAVYLPDDGIVVFVTASGSYAYEIETKDFWKDVVSAEDKPFVGISVEADAEYGDDMYSVDLIVSIGSFDKDTGKATLSYTSSGDPVTLTKVSDTVYSFKGKNYFSELVDAYLLIDGDSFSLMSKEEYLFLGTHTADGHTIVIAAGSTSGKYSVTLDSYAAVEVEPDFSKDNFSMSTSDAEFVISWKIENSQITFSCLQLPLGTMKMEGSGYAYEEFNTGYGVYYELTVTFTEVLDGVAQYNVKWSLGWSTSGTVTGTLSENGEYVIATVNGVDVFIYVNGINDYDVAFVMLEADDAVSGLLGTNETDAGKLSVSVGVEGEYDWDDNFDGFGTPEFVVTLDGVKCAVTTDFSSDCTSIEFSCNGKTYVATVSEGTVTATEKAAA